MKLAGILPYTIMANGKVLEDIKQLKLNDAVTDGIDATVSNQKQLLYNIPIKQIDVINIISRFSTFDELQKPSDDGKSKSSLLRRETFKDSIRSAKVKAWPVDSFGAKIGQNNSAFSSISIAALNKRESHCCGNASTSDAVCFLTGFLYTCGSSRAYIADRFKVDKQLHAWRKDERSFDMAAFEKGLMRVVLRLAAVGMRTFPSFWSRKAVSEPIELTE
eukprot:12149-Heterococcus_DN1.PRE.3